jgi:DNA-binding transcriptional MerR regulator
MSIEKEETKKLYYTIGEVSELFDINASTIRFWEKEFKELKPIKNKKGNRVFTQKDIDLLSKIVELVKSKGFTIQGARDQLKQPDLFSLNAEIIEKLIEIKERLISMRNSIED